MDSAGSATGARGGGGSDPGMLKDMPEFWQERTRFVRECLANGSPPNDVEMNHFLWNLMDQLGEEKAAVRASLGPPLYRKHIYSLST